MTRPARALVSARALRHNLGRVRDHAPGARVMAVVKADAYGHGLSWAAAALAEADGFAVVGAEEGTALRVAGVRQPVTLLAGIFEPSEVRALAEQKLTPVIHSFEQIAMLEASGDVTGLDVWLKIDTGMHRIGFAPGEVAGAAQQLRACRAVARVGWFSHLADADDPTDPLTTRQVELFRDTLAGERGERSLANSAGIVAWPDSHYDWVRPGIMLYGASPLLGRPASALGLEPVMTLQTRIIAVHRRRRGDRVGYGGDWVCPEDMPVGVAAIGYGDGYPRHARTATPVLIEGERAALIGRVSMDMITLDLRTRPGTKVGDEVTLWGEGLPVDEVAAQAGTISYELLSGVTNRVPRVERGN